MGHAPRWLSSASVGAIARVLAIFSGLVTAAFWLLTLLTVWIREPGAFTGAGDYFGGALFFWITTVLPSLLLPGVHTLVVGEAVDRVGPRWARAVSVAMALAIWPIPLLDDALRSTIDRWGLPLLAVLSLYGWHRGSAFGAQRMRVDALIERLGIGITLAFCLAFAGLIAYAWVSVWTAGAP